ncbi:Leukotriene A-4 hydrolase-like protein, partial [Zancudomyces culisetae]
MSAKIDPNTLSNLEQVTTERLHLDLEVDFENKLLKGSVTLCHVVLQDNVDKVVLDTMTLDIYKAWLVNQHGGETAQDKTELQFKCGKVHHIYGTPLEIELDRKYQKGEKLSIQIAYKTTEK